MRTFISLMSLFVAAEVGCNGHGEYEASPEPNLRMVAVLYSQYLAAHGGEAPRDENDFAGYVDSLGPGVLQRAGVRGTDRLFVSQRDGKPYVVKCGDEDWPLDGSIAYEQIGADGTRFVVTELGRVSEITEAEFQVRLKNRR